MKRRRLLPTDEMSPRSENQPAPIRASVDKSVRNGVSVVICCHNSAERLPVTLRHLSVQEHTNYIPWEVIVVDNASTDGTGSVAEANWPAGSPTPLRVVSEPVVGLAHARRRGFAKSTYEFVSFVDDDNWVCSDWVFRVAEVMSLHPDAGACGGEIEPAFEVAPPTWFDRYKENYAIGAQAEAGGDVTDDRGYLWGAGLTIRKSAYQGLLAGGFSSILTGREGGTLAAGEDAELCLALRLAGWRLWYDPCLRMFHYVPAARLTWSYLCRVVRGFGSSSVGLDCYLQSYSDQPVQFLRWLRRSWWCQALLASARLSIHVVCHPIIWLSRREGSTVTLKIEWQLGRIGELVRQRRTYGASCSNASRAS